MKNELRLGAKLFSGRFLKKKQKLNATKKNDDIGTSGVLWAKVRHQTAVGLSNTTDLSVLWDSERLLS